MNSAAKDLLIIVPDVDMEEGLKNLLRRHQSLGIRPITFDIRRHPGRDPGVRTGGVELARPFTRQYGRCLLFLDREGCGVPGASTDSIRAELLEGLKASGWKGRAEAVVLDPEFESWVWANSPHVAKALGWKSRDLGNWLRRSPSWDETTQKPGRPKEAMQAALREVRRPRSPAIYGEIGARVNFRECQDKQFQHFLSTLTRWFPR